MKNNFKLFTYRIISFFLGSFFFIQCTSKKDNGPLFYNEAFNQYISAFTDFEISRKTPIVVRFTENKVSDDKIGSIVEDGLVSVDPQIEGKFTWMDSKTIEFSPEAWLPSNTQYQIEVKLTKLFKNVPDSLENFIFAVKTKEQYYKINSLGLRPGENNDITTQIFNGEIQTADVEKAEEIIASIEALHDGEKVKINWELPKEGETVFPFEIKNLKRKKTNTTLKLTLNSSKLSANNLDATEIQIPAQGRFEITGHKVSSHPDKLVIIEFSDPLDPKQVIQGGLIKTVGFSYTSAIEGNIIKLFPKGTINGSCKVTVNKGIKNIIGQACEDTKTFDVLFVDYDPEVKLLGKGTIIPQGQTLPFPFEAVNLSAVDLRVIKIQEDNIPQFLQVNKLEGSYQLKRVGEVVAEKTIVLNPKLNLKDWNKHSIDLSTLVQTEPGAIYRVAIGFKRSYSLYNCTEADTLGGDKMLDLGEGWSSPSSYGYYDDYYDEDEYYYDYSSSWEDRKDPCKSAYYHSGRIAEKNILSSNIGLIAKKGTNNEFFFAATNLMTTEPIAGLTFEVYSYQQRLITTLKSDENGWASAKIKDTPFLLVAKNNKERGYLRLDNGTSLSLSNFDVSGNSYHKGLKGFIYGERGVWRPGDDIFLTFILEDKEKALPANHPVVLEFLNPQGQMIYRSTNKNGLNGFYHFKLKTTSESITGDYSVRIHAGGTTFYKNIKVETIQPNRLKINLNIPENQIVKNKTSSAVLKSTWLHGAKAKNLNADVAVKLSNTTTTFELFKDYDFDFDARNNNSSERQVIFDGKLDENGEALVDLDIESNDEAPGMMKAQFNVKVFEPGGNFSTDVFSIPYHPYAHYVGIKTPTRDRNSYYYATDKDHKIDLALVDRNGKATQGNSTVNVEVYKIGWRWWWDDGSDEVGYYSRNSHNKHSAHSITMQNGRGSFNFRANHDSWGRFLIVATNQYGHKSSKIIYLDWPGYYRTSAEGASGAKMLSFTADKENYNVGDEVTLSIPTPKKGKVLVSIESGNKVLETKWVTSNGTTTDYKFIAKEGMDPVCYAYVMLLQPQGNTSNDLPIRMYGVIPLKVENPASRLNPTIKMPNELTPNSKVSVEVGESKGKAMTYTIAMVDEGLLDLTRYTTPDVWTAFNQRQALSVKTWDCFDDVANAQFAGIANLLSIGGDMEAAGAEAKKVNRFKPVVYYAGPFYLPAGSSKIHQIEIPNYIGSVKTMVVAGDNFAYGNAEKVTPVKKPLMVLATLPRVVSPGERISFPVTVFAMKDHVKDVTVTIEKHEMFEVLGSKAKQIRFNEQGDQLVEFELKSLSKTGVAKVKVSAKSGNESSFYEIELEVRSPNPVVTESSFAMLAKGKVMTQNVELFGIQGTNKVKIELSSTPPINLESRLKYLIHYPYGCIEQTTSSVFPQLYLSKLQKMNQTQKDEIELNVKAGIQRLASFQTADGGFAYWPGNTYSNEWGTNYAGHFLIEAQNAGYDVPKDMMRKWRNYQSKLAKDFNKDDKWYKDMYQAYRLYVLAKAGYPELGAMNQLKTTKLNDKVKWYLAAAYYLAGQRTIGQEIIANLNKEIPEYQQFSHTYGSATRDKAIILEVLTLMKSQQEAYKLSLEISKALSTERWMSTQTTAYSLVAMAKYMLLNPSPDKIIAEVYVNGKKQLIETEMNIISIDAGSLQHNNEVKVVNNSNGSLYTKILNVGVPKVDQTSDGSNLMSLNISYQDLDGRVLNPTLIEQGTDFKMSVTVGNSSSSLFLEEIVLNVMMPSGWEIHNSRMTGISEGKNDSFDYQDLRDDRVFTFFDLKAHQSKTFTFFLNASYVGEFFQPSILAYPMYDESIYARKKGDVVKVVKKVGN